MNASPKKPVVAYLIMAHGNYKHLNKLLLALNDDHARFFLHIDKKSPMPDHLELKDKVEFIERINVWWGGWSVQKAINNLLKTALKTDANYFVLLSGADYPVKPGEFFYSKLKEGGEYISLYKGFLPHKPESRIKYFHFDGANRWNKKSLKTLIYFGLEKVQYLIKFIRKRKYPFDHIFFGPTWWALSRECAEYVTSYIQNHPECIAFYKTSWCPDESFVHTIIGNSQYLKKCKGSLTYTDWSEKKSSPARINKSHVRLLKEQQAGQKPREWNTGHFFARKFDDQSEDVIQLIDRELRT